MDPFIGEIRMFGFNFAPVGWAFCAGQIIPIQQSTTLFALLGTQFGGNGTTTFGLPNLQGYVAINQGQGPGLSGYYVGQTAGLASVTLQANQLAPHTHQLNANTTSGTVLTANGNVLATSTVGARGSGTVGQVYSTKPGGATNPLDQRSIAPAGGGGAHNNMQPYLVLNYCIALQGVYPPRQ